MKKTFKAVAFSPEGDYITEGDFESIEKAWSRIEDWGSRWIFYPIVAVASDTKIVSACEGFKFMEGQKINEVKVYFKNNTNDIAEYCQAIF